MTRFIYGLDGEVSEMQKMLVADGLSQRFPGVEFQFAPRPDPLLENKIIPLVGRPHPADPERSIIEMVPDALRDRVREAFEGLLATSAALTPS